MGRLDLDAYLTFQRARLDAQTKKLPAAVARAAGLSASGLSEPELRQLDRVVTDVLAALTQAQSHPAVAALPTLEKQLPTATAQEKAELEASIAEARKLEAELTVQALVPVRQKHGDDKVEQVLARQDDLAQVMYFKANALVPLRE
jgi:paraquat-inducible protein B